MVGSYYATVLLSTLGVALLVAGVLPLVTSASWSMRRSGLTMELLGVVMVLVSGLVPGMDALVSDGMLVVGGLMIVNVILMQRSRKDGTM